MNKQIISMVLALLFIPAFSPTTLAQIQNAEPAGDIFMDIPSSDDDYGLTAYLKERNIFNGYSDGYFEKDLPINRAELMAVTVRMQGIEPKLEEYKNCFPDVQEEWFAPYICYGKTQGWIKGYDDGLFRPANKTSVPESFKIVTKPVFKDQIAPEVESKPWFAPYISFVSDKNLIGSNKYPDGLVTSNATRIGVADLIFRSLMLHENGWDAYHDYLADQVLVRQGKESWASPQYPCYEPLAYLDYIDGYASASYNDAGTMPLPSFMRDYIEQAYGIDYLIKFGEDPFTLPYFYVNGFCLLQSGETMLLGSSKDEDGNNQRHLIKFDDSKKLIKDQTIACPKEDMIFSGTHLPAFVLSHLEPDSFELIDCLYAKSKSWVYMKGDFYLDDAEPDGFKRLTYPYSTDGVRIYDRDLPMDKVDLDDFTPLLPQNSPVEFGPYAKSGGKIYYNRYEVPSVDLETFKPVDVPDLPLDYFIHMREMDYSDVFSYAKDKNTVYGSGEALDHLDPATFEIIDSLYAKDKNGIYVFTDVRDENDWYDYYYAGPLEGVDVDTFESLHSFYGKDKNAVYFRYEKLEGVDPSTVSLLENVPEPLTWLKTNKGIYHFSELLHEIVDPESFAFMDDHYAKDSKHVYYYHRGNFWLVEGADPATFVRVKDLKGYSNWVHKDKDSVYYQGYTLGQNGEYYNVEYYVDKQSLAYADQLDAASVTLIGDRLIQDKNGVTCNLRIPDEIKCEKQ